MRILVLANKMPYPPKDGGSIATFSLADAFSKLGHHVTILAMNTSKHYFETSLIPSDISERVRFIAVYVKTDLSPLAALKNLLFSELPYNAVRFISGDFRQKLVELLKAEEFDLVQLEGLYLSPYVDDIRNHSQATVAMRSHNVEHEIWERAVKQQSGWKKWYVRNLADRIRKMEISYLNSYDLMIPITDRDGKRFEELGCKLPRHTASTGMDISGIRPDMSRMEYPSVFHLGALDWIPNQEGLEWFLGSIWPSIHKRFPGLKFYVAGRNAPAYIRDRREPGMEFVGEVEDAHEFMNSKAIMVVPLLAGSGMRIKIVEGMALGKSIVSTSVGAEGIPCEHGKNILIADTAEEFITQVIRLIEDELLFSEIGKEARELVRKNFDNLAVARSLINFYCR